MSQKLQLVNLFGVIVLVAICVVQWRQNRQLNLNAIVVEKTRQTQEQKINEQEKSIRGLNEDLTRFKEQFTSARSELTETREKLGASERTLRQLAAEKDHLQTVLTNWMQAVTDRDTKLKEANERIANVTDQLNASVRKFNELVTNYNALVVRHQSLGTNAPRP